MLRIMIRNSEIGFECTYENVKHIAPYCEENIVYGKLVFENGETVTFNMNEFEFFDLTSRKIEKFKTDFIYK